MPKTGASTLTPEQRVMRARLAAHESWANTGDRSARTAAARAAHQDKFLRQARERYGDLPADQLAARAASLKSAHYARLALASSKARAARRGAGRS